MDKNKLMDILREEQYPEYMIDKTVAKLENLAPDVKNAFQAWIQGADVSSFAVEGYSFANLVHEKGMKPVGAFLALDWLTKDPQEALACLQRRIR